MLSRSHSSPARPFLCEVNAQHVWLQQQLPRRSRASTSHSSDQAALPSAPRPAPPAEPSPLPRALGWRESPCPSLPAFLHPWAMLASVPSFPSPPHKGQGSTTGKPILHIRFGLVLSASFSSEEESSSSSSSSAEGSASAREETSQLNIRAWTLPERGQSGTGASWAGGTGLCPVGQPGQGSADAWWGGVGIPGERCACPPAQPGLTVPAVPVLTAHGHHGAICPQR